jgi:hypothetical protein
MIKKALVLLLTATLLAACSTPQKVGTPLIPNKSIQLTSKLALPYSDLLTSVVIAAAIHFIYDPLAPNWEIEEAQLSDDTYRFSLKMKRYHTGGAGESIQILKRRASQLQVDQGFAAYQLIEYTEGIESQTLGARRVAEGTIKLVQRQQADSFMQNSRN